MIPYVGCLGKLVGVRLVVTEEFEFRLLALKNPPGAQGPLLSVRTLTDGLFDS